MGKVIKIYTDGACSRNPGPGGWGAIVIIDGKERIESGFVEDTTNNRMELLACLLYTSPSPRDRTRSRMPSSA